MKREEPEMIFNKQIIKDKDGKITTNYTINGKNVSEHAFMGLSDDIYFSKYNEKLNIDDAGEPECDCPDCQVLRETIGSIKQLDDRDALEYLRNFIEANMRVVELNTQIETYNAFAKESFKIASQLELALEQEYNNTEEYYEDDEE